jgi:hypothetical protein
MTLGTTFIFVGIGLVLVGVIAWSVALLAN